jgi:hypothetical protein
MGKKQQKQQARGAARRASKTSCLVKKAPAAKHAAKPAVGKGPKALYVPQKTQTVKLGSRRPGGAGGGPSAEKLALKQRRREEAEAAAAARGRADGAAFAAARAGVAPEAVVIAPASFAVEAKESGAMRWLFDVDTARTPRQPAPRRAAAPPRRDDGPNAFAALGDDADAPPPPRPAAPAAPVVAPPTALVFAPPTFVVGGHAPGPAEFEDI